MTEVHTVAEREQMLRQMSDASSTFYAMARAIGCHPFIEFTGLINEYIEACRDAHNEGIDFTQCNKHAGQHLPMAPYRVDYVNEKLECIFTGRSVMAKEAKKEPCPNP